MAKIGKDIEGKQAKVIGGFKPVSEEGRCVSWEKETGTCDGTLLDSRCATCERKAK
jgi:hypothetical protein